MSEPLILTLPLPYTRLRAGASGHWGSRSKYVKLYKQEVMYALMEERHKHIPCQLKSMKRVRISYTFYNARSVIPDGRYCPQDQENGFYCMKAAVDALVNAGLLPNDTPKYVEMGIVRTIPAKENKSKLREVRMEVEEMSDHIPDITKKVDVPNPGSKEAYEMGCICPKDQPQAFQGLFWQVVGCPIHGKKEEATDEL